MDFYLVDVDCCLFGHTLGELQAVRKGWLIVESVLEKEVVIAIRTVKLLDLGKIQHQSPLIQVFCQIDRSFPIFWLYLFDENLFFDFDIDSSGKFSFHLYELMLTNHKHIAYITELTWFIVPLVKSQFMKHFVDAILLPRPFLQVFYQLI